MASYNLQYIQNGLHVSLFRYFFFNFYFCPLRSSAGGNFEVSASSAGVLSIHWIAALQTTVLYNCLTFSRYLFFFFFLPPPNRIPINLTVQKSASRLTGLAIYRHVSSSHDEVSSSELEVFAGTCKKGEKKKRKSRVTERKRNNVLKMKIKMVGGWCHCHLPAIQPLGGKKHLKKKQHRIKSTVKSESQNIIYHLKKNDERKAMIFFQPKGYSFNITLCILLTLQYFKALFRGDYITFLFNQGFKSTLQV